MGLFWDNIWECKTPEMPELLLYTGNKENVWDKVGNVLGICWECPGNKPNSNKQCMEYLPKEVNHPFSDDKFNINIFLRRENDVRRCFRIRLGKLGTKLGIKLNCKRYI